MSTAASFITAAEFPALTNAYLFGDFDAGGNIWALRRLTNNTVSVERLANAGHRCLWS
jgi:hypothetical protein